MCVRARFGFLYKEKSASKLQRWSFEWLLRETKRKPLGIHPGDTPSKRSPSERTPHYRNLPRVIFGGGPYVPSFCWGLPLPFGASRFLDLSQPCSPGLWLQPAAWVHFTGPRSTWPFSEGRTMLGLVDGLAHSMSWSRTKRRFPKRPWRGGLLSLLEGGRLLEDGRAGLPLVL